MTSLLHRSVTTAGGLKSAPGAGATTRISETIPYKGDDAIQKMAKTMQWPMLAMGSMTVVAAFVMAVAGGISFGDFFSPSGVASDLGSGEALVQLTGAFLFLGMGLILAAITMTLVNIVRHLREAGRDVQTSLGARALQLKKPWTGTATPMLMMMGVMTEMVAFVVGIVTAVTIGGVDAASIADPSGATSGDLADIGFVRAVGTWLPGLRLTGLAMILIAIVLALTTIQKVIRFQGDRVAEIAATTSA
ncbi:hypothetical protein [Ilumatobacter sp.]|uniref:hypothetical protein n=1 Tax=Ilumatobacter sp. TaxID=1967498 RepID=UPI003750EAB5